MSTNPHETEPNLGAALESIGAMTSLLDEALAHPDPDPETLPDIPPGWHPASQEAAERLCLAILKSPAGIEDLKARARKHALDWETMIRVAEERVEERQAALLRFLLKHNCKLTTPWFTARAQPHGPKIVVNNADRAIEVCKAEGWTAAIRTKEEVAKAEFDTFFNAAPEAFEVHGPDGKPIAESVPREPSLVITPTAAGRRLKEMANGG